jgi:hypothetical protein
VTWLIIEPQFDGHHFAYLERIVQGAIERGIRVIVGVGDDDQGQKTMAGLRRRFGTGAPAFVVSPLPEPCRVLTGVPGMACNEVRHRRFLKTVYRKALDAEKIDLVFLPFLDWSLFAISLLGSPFGTTSFAGITMRPKFHFRELGIPAAYDRLAPAKDRLFRKLLRIPTLKRILTIDETLPEYLHGRKAHSANKVVYFPDPSDARTELSREEARKKLGLPENASIVLAYGYLDARKGIARLLKWIMSDAVPPSAYLLAVGSQASDVEALFADSAVRGMIREGRIKAVNEFVSDDDEAVFFRASDLVWLAYDNFEDMSGVLVRAAQHGLAVVFKDRGLISRYARRYGREPQQQDRCAPLIAAIPSDLTARTFEGVTGRPPLPDHSWANAVQLIYG